MIIGAGVVTFLVTEANFLTQSNLSRGGLFWFTVERNVKACCQECRSAPGQGASQEACRGGAPLAFSFPLTDPSPAQRWQCTEPRCVSSSLLLNFLSQIKSKACLTNVLCIWFS